VARKKPRNHTTQAVKPEKSPRRGLLWGGIAVAALAVVGALLYFSYRSPNPGPLPGGEGRRGV
jgi:hypothetical protein